MSKTPTNAAFKKIIANNITDDYIQLIRGSDMTVLLWVDAAGIIQGVNVLEIQPAGADTNVQFNDAGALGGNSGFTYTKATHIATLLGGLTLGGQAASNTGIFASGTTLNVRLGDNSADAPITFSSFTGTANSALNNTTAATGGANQSSPILKFSGNYWTGSASAVDTYTFQNAIGAGSNPQTTLSIIHSGSGTGIISFNGALNVNTLATSAGITSSSNILLEQTSAATSLANQNSNSLEVSGNYWTGSASAADTWSWQDVLGAGTNPTSTLTLSHSGSSGVAALNFGSSSLMSQSANGASLTVGQASELLTLSLASAHTDTSANLLPTGAIIDSVVIYITQTISGGSTPTTIAVGDASTSNRFISTGTPLTAGSSAVGLNQIDAGASSQNAAAKVRVTLDQIPGQGIVRITVFYRQFTAPTS